MTYVAKRAAGSTITMLIDVPREDLSLRLKEAMGIYAAAMGYSPASGVHRGAQTIRHSEYPSFRCRAALTDSNQMVGFAYGYASRPGQWWHDLVARAVGRSGSGWLADAFELSELHVLPEAQGQRIGERLLRSLAQDLDYDKIVLSTPEGDNRAWRLYRRLGFLDLVRNHMFPGDSRPFGVLGAALPFTDAVE